MRLIDDDGTEIQLGHVSVVDLHPTDVVVVKSMVNFDHTKRDRIYKIMRGIFPDNKVLVIPLGLEVEVIRE